MWAAIIIETRTTPDGNVWFRNPFPDRIGNKWIDAHGFIALLRTGLSFKELPSDAQDSVTRATHVKKRKGRNNKK